MLFLAPGIIMVTIITKTKVIPHMEGSLRSISSSSIKAGRLARARSTSSARAQSLRKQDHDKDEELADDS